MSERRTFFPPAFDMPIAEGICALGVRLAAYVFHAVDVYTQHAVSSVMALLDLVADILAGCRFRAN
jgi:hypothetical protein